MLCRSLSALSAPHQRHPVRCGGTIFLAVWLLFAGARAATFDVDSPADVPDVLPGDGKCETVVDSHVACTLRAAVQEANALAGKDAIHLQADTTYLLTRVGIEDAALFGSLDIDDSVDIVGAGPASTIVDGNGAVTNDRVFLVAACSALGCPTVVVTMTGITIRHGHSAARGGGIASALFIGHEPEVTLTNCRIEENASDSDGGGIYSGGPVTLAGSVVSGNTAVTGGGAYLGGNSVITDSTFSGNTAAGNGGGIAARYYAMINRSTISGNQAHVDGGGVYSATFANPSFQLYIANSTIFGNSSDGSGGGLESASGGANLFNVTIAGNTANADRSGSDGGGGVANAANASLSFANGIIAGNIVRISNSLFSVLNDCGGTIASQGYNIVTHATCTVLGAYSTSAVQFGPFDYYGGTTKTLALLPGSGGIDAGNPTGCTDDQGAILQTDQRGQPRPVGAACDLGAYELQPDPIFENGFEV